MVKAKPHFILQMNYDSEKNKQKKHINFQL